MTAQTLNIIYDTNYTGIVNGGGFVDHNFPTAAPKAGFFDLLF
jgi:hypothetical protein